MVNKKKERIKLEKELRVIGDGNLTSGYIRVGKKDKYLEGGSKNKLAEVRLAIDIYNAKQEKPKETVDEVLQDQEESKVYTEVELEDMNFKKLKKLGNSMGTTGRGKQELIKEILEIQNE